MLELFVPSFLVSLVAAWTILRRQGFVSSSRDSAFPGSHKIHEGSVPRIGGIAVVLGWLVGLGLAALGGRLPWLLALFWILCLLPVVAGGLMEDFTKRVSARVRLLLSQVSGVLAYYLLNVAAVRLDVPGGEALLALPFASFLVTVVAISGVAHAVNIIDGLHGLALTICIMAFAAMGYVAFCAGDEYVLLMCGLGAAAALGLRAWNYPSGSIFCGDGGAYFMGTYLAIVGGLLVARNDGVSAWFPVVTLLYPIWETVFSAYRRKAVLRVPASRPDRLHLHTLVYAHMAGSARHGGPEWKSRRNSDATHTLLLLALLNVLPGILWWDRSRYLVASALVFVIVYLLLYRRVSAPHAVPAAGGDFLPWHGPAESLDGDGDEGREAPPLVARQPGAWVR